MPSKEEQYPDDTLIYALSFVKPVLKIKDNDTLCVRIADHDFPKVDNKLLLDVLERVEEYILEINTKYYYKDWIIRTRALYNALQREVLHRMDLGYKIATRIRTHSDLTDNRALDICDFLRFDCGINSNCLDERIADYDFSRVSDLILSKDFTYIKHSYIKRHWSIRKCKLLNDWITLYHKALKLELTKRWNKCQSNLDKVSAKHWYKELTEAYNRVVLGNE